MVEALNSKTTEWKQEIEFKQDDARLLSMLEDYTNARQEKEQEPHKLRLELQICGGDFVSQMHNGFMGTILKGICCAQDQKKEKPPLKRLRRSLKLEFDESDDADLFKDESASGHEVK